MKKILFAFFLLFIGFAASCNNNNNTVGPGGAISFTISGQVDSTNQNNYIFGFRPSVDTKLTSIIVGLPAQPFFDTLTNGNQAYIFDSDTTYTLDPYTGVQSGQAWTFQFAGNIVSNNEAYNVTMPFTP